MSEQTPEPTDVDPRNNPESRVAEGEASQTEARVTDSGPIISTAPSAEEGADGVIDGEVTGMRSGDVLAGVTISDKDADEAVPGDTGPEHPGERR